MAGSDDSENILHLVRASCKSTVATSPHVQIEYAAARRFVEEVLADVPADKLVPPFDLPLQFDALDDEINLWTLLQLVNIGSGYRHELHDAVGAGAWDTMIRGILSMHLMGAKITADFMAGLDQGGVAEYFGIQPNVEVQVLPAVYQAKPGPLFPLVDMLKSIVNQAGFALRNRGESSFADFFRSHAKMSAAPTAASFVRNLVDTFDGFRDVTEVRGTRVYLCKKAQLCAAYCHRKFSATAPEIFAFTDIAALTVMADNVLPAVLRAAGVLLPSGTLCDMIDTRKTVPAGELETDLRAASVVACEYIVAHAKAVAAAPSSALPDEIQRNKFQRLASLTEADLDEFLWTYGKRPELRTLERHATKNTCFY